MPLKNLPISPRIPYVAPVAEVLAADDIAVARAQSPGNKLPGSGIEACFAVFVAGIN